jgi:lysozyme
MRLSIAGLNLIKRYEGFSSKPYLCPAGVPTIGYGSTYYENNRKVELTDASISEDWALELLMNNLVLYEKAVDSMVTSSINQKQFDALVSFCYNVGVTNFKKSTLLKLVNNNPLDPNIAIQFGRWTRANGKILTGLVKRRKSEAHLYFSS